MKLSLYKDVILENLNFSILQYEHNKWFDAQHRILKAQPNPQLRHDANRAAAITLFIFFLLGGKGRKHEAARQNAKVFDKVLRFVCPFHTREIPKIMQIEIYHEDIQNAAIGGLAHETISQQHEAKKKVCDACQQ